MSRPRNAFETESVTVTAGPKLILYLDDLIADEGYGPSRGEVAKTLVWQRIHSLIQDGTLARRQASAKEREQVAKRIAKRPAKKTRGRA
jgi:hypothetical protein